MSRVKSQEELEREEADAKMARQMMAEEEYQTERDHQLALQMQQQQQQQQRQHAQQHAQYQQQHQQQAHMQQQQQPMMAAGANQVMCPACMSINNLNPANLHLQHMCGTCRRLLPNRAAQVGNSQSALTPQSQGAPTQLPQQQAPQPQTKTLRCQHCNADNIVPAAASGAFKCGHCQQVLQSTQAQVRPTQVQVPHQQQHTSQTPPPQHDQHQPMDPAAQQQQPHQHQHQHQRPVLQAQSIDPPPQNLEVRCGKCPAINAVPRDPRTPGVIQFKCGGCGALNKAQYA